MGDGSLQLYREADLHEEKDRISRSLGATRDPNLIQRVLQFAMSVSVCIYLVVTYRKKNCVSKSTIIQFAFEIMNISCINHYCIKFIPGFYASIWEAVLFYVSLACSPFQFLFVSFCISVNTHKHLCQFFFQTF